MLIVMLAVRTWQDMTQERVLSVGEVYDLPDVIARDLIAAGVARQHTMEGPIETKPEPRFETAAAPGADARRPRRAS